MPVIPPITDLPAAPNIGSPATFAALASAFVAAQVAMVAEINDFIDAINNVTFSAMFAVYGGTANAITLTTGAGLTEIPTGTEIRFRATAANSGAATINLDSLGVKTVKTVTGTALPANYIRTGIDTRVIYDGTDFIAYRAPEYGLNANGRYCLLENGWAMCAATVADVTGLSIAVGSNYGSSDYALPLTLTQITSRTYVGYVTDAGGANYGPALVDLTAVSGGNNWRFGFRNFSGVTVTRVVNIAFGATGTWY